jgi:hypothetical protein
MKSIIKMEIKNNNLVIREGFLNKTQSPEAIKEDC